MLASTHPPLVPFNKTEAWSKENLSTIDRQWNLSPDEHRQMETLRDRLEDVEHWKNDPFEVVRLLRFLRGNLDDVESSIRKTVAWRLQGDIDAFLQSYRPHPLFDHYPSAVLDGVDRDGDPILLERPGKADLAGYQRIFSRDEMLLFVRAIREQLVSRNPHQPDNWQQSHYEPTYGQRVKFLTVLVDLDGLGRQHVQPGLLATLQTVARIAQDHYAGTVKRIVILRAPSIFKWVWAVVKNFVDANVRELLVFSNHQDYLQVLDKYIDRSVLPPVLCPEFGKGGVIPQYRHVNLEGGLLSACGKQPDCRTKDTSDTDVLSERSSISSRSPSMDVIPEDKVGKTDMSTCTSSSGVSSVVLFRGGWKLDSQGDMQVSIE